MNQFTKSIAATERMSGFDGDEFNEGGAMFSGLEDDGYMGMDGDESYASGGSQGVAYTDPYIISIENTGTVSRTATIFGYSQNFGSVNFGNSVDLVFTNIVNPTGGYSQLLVQSFTKQFKIGKWRFESTSPTQMLQTLNLYISDANGYTQSKPLPLSQLKDPYQYNAQIVESKKMITVDANTYGTIIIPAGATLTITMYPTMIASIRRKMLGGNELNSTVAPRTAAKNTPITVINTTQPVRSLGGS